MENGKRNRDGYENGTRKNGKKNYDLNKKQKIEECKICCDPYNKNRKKIICEFGCGGEYCSKCVEEYIKNSVNQPGCMNCRKSWTFQFVEGAFTPASLKRIHEYQKRIYLNEDKSFLPEAQLEIEKEKEIDALNERKRELLRMLRDIDYYIEIELNQKQRITVTKKCPLDGCRGFLSTGYVCGICDSNICDKCMKKKSETHVCRQEDVDTYETVKKISRPCPKCGISTEKIDGCPQMFCMNPECHVAWNWNTGTIEQGIIHNPHYFQWVAQQGGSVERNPLDVQCGGIPSPRTVLKFRRFTNIHEERQKFDRIYCRINYIQTFRIQNPPTEKNNQDIRMKYLKKIIDEEHYAFCIMKRKRSYFKLREFYGIHQMFITASTDILQRIQNHKNIKLLFEEMENLRKYYMDCIDECCQRYKVKKNLKKYFHKIDENWLFVDF